MNESEKDLVVIGGGPAGLLSAISASRNNADVTLLESKETIGLHEHCAGLLSIDGLKSLGLFDLPSDVIQNTEIKGSRIYSPSGKLLIVQKTTPTAWVVNRARFDAHLASLARDQGINIRTSSKVTQVTRQKDCLRFKLGKRSSSEILSSKLAILAEGRFPTLNEQLELPKPLRKDIVFASQFIMSGVKDINAELVEIYQYNSLVPGFFAWIIPLNDSTAKIGLGTTTPPAGKLLDTFMKKHPIAKKKLSSAKIEKRMSGAIPIGSNIKRTFTDNVLVVGDAAGQTKPTTGGGVIFGGVAANIAGDVVGKALKTNDFSSRFLSQYEQRWKKEFGLNLKIMKLVRNYLNSLNDDHIEKLFTKLDKPKIKEKISKFGDVDNQAKIVFRLLSNHSLWPFIIGTGARFLFKKN